jgi:molybdopterin adenylyltransferase
VSANAAREAGGNSPREAGEAGSPSAGVSRSVLVLTASDQSASGGRQDASGAAVGERLAGLGFVVERAVVPDEQAGIEAALRDASRRHPLIVTTGGTGLTPRDVTPQATLVVIDYEVPGMAEAMRAAGRRHTPMADLSRAVVGVCERTLIVNLPGSPKGAIESLDAIVPVLDHALETLAGPFDHGSSRAPALADAPSDLADPRVIAFPDEHE